MGLKRVLGHNFDGKKGLAILGLKRALGLFFMKAPML